MLKLFVLLSFVLLILKDSVCLNMKHNTNEMMKVIDEYLSQNRTNTEIFEIWRKMYKKPYKINSDEGRKRFTIFSDNLKKINAHNSDKLNSYKLGLNQFTDMTHEEFMAYNKGRLKINTSYVEDLEELLEEDFEWKPIDWRPIMTPVRNQGKCKSWWAFPLTGLLESIYWIKNKNKKGAVNEWLSPQQLIDCQTKMSGCDGGYFPGDINLAINYFKVRGAMRDKDYNYKSKSNYMCYYDESEIKNLKISNINKATNRTETYNLLQKGPVMTFVGQSEDFLNYQGGIFDGKNCERSRYNMGALLVGYGEENGIGFWIVRMSYGKDWGEGGYIRIKRESGDDCFVPFNGYQVDLE